MPEAKTVYYGTDRRKGDAGAVVTSLKIALRAAEGEPLDVEGMFKNAFHPTGNNVRLADLEDEKLKNRVDALLRTAAIDDVEAVDYVTKLICAKYQDSLDTLKLGEKPLYDAEKPQEGDVLPPTLDQAIKILTAHISSEQSAEIQSMKKPEFQLVPVTSMARYVSALNAYKPIPEQSDARIPTWNQGAFERADQRDGVNGDAIIGWKIAVTEGANMSKISDGDDEHRVLTERQTWFMDEFASKGVCGVDFKKIFLLMMKSLKNGKPIDDILENQGSSTFVNEEPAQDGEVCCVYWGHNGKQVNLGVGEARRKNTGARFRTSIVVDVPIA